MNFEQIRQVLEEHLNTINDNTAEIQALFDYLRELEIKVERLSQRLDVVQLSDKVPAPLTLAPLNHTERNVFLILYTEEQPLNNCEIASRARLSASLVPECLSSLVYKGIPLQRSFVNDQLFWKLNPLFKERQAKENIINLSLQSFL